MHSVRNQRPNTRTPREQAQTRPVPKPRKRLNAAIKENHENVMQQCCIASTITRQKSSWIDWYVPWSWRQWYQPELPPKPDFLKVKSIEDKNDVDDAPREERSPPLPPRCPGPYQFGFPAYLVVDVTDFRAVEEKALRLNTIKDEEVLYSYANYDRHVFKQNSVRQFDLSLVYPQDRRKGYTDMESPGVNGISYVVMERNEKMEMDGKR